MENSIYSSFKKKILLFQSLKTTSYYKQKKPPIQTRYTEMPPRASKAHHFPIGFPSRARFESFVTFNQPSIPANIEEQATCFIFMVASRWWWFTVSVDKDPGRCGLSVNFEISKDICGPWLICMGTEYHLSKLCVPTGSWISTILGYVGSGDIYVKYMCIVMLGWWCVLFLDGFARNR